MVPLWCDLRLKLIASIRYEIAEAQHNIEIITRGAPSPTPFIPSEGCVQRAEVAAGCDTLSHCDTFHFTVVWFENKYENSFHLPAKKEFHWVSLLFSYFLSLPYLSIFMRAVCLVLLCRIVSYRVVLSRVTDHVQHRHLGLTVCSVEYANLRPRSRQARETQDYPYLWRWLLYWMQLNHISSYSEIYIRYFHVRRLCGMWQKRKY